MKQRILSAATAFSLLLGAPSGTLADAPIDTATATLGRGAELIEQTWWTGADYVTEHYIDLAPPDTAGLRPMVVSGDVLTDTAALNELAREMEDRGLHVAAGLNGGFYTLSSGVPVGLVVRDGLLRSDDDGLTGLGFAPDGTAVIGGSMVWLTLNTGAGPVPVQTVNHTRREGLALFTGDFDDRTDAAGPGWNLLCTYAPDPVTGEVPAGLPMSGTVALTVTEVLPAAGRVDIPPAGLVLSLAWDTETPAPDWLAALAPGSPLTLTVHCAEGWEDTDSALCLLYPLLENGEIVAGLDKYAERAPRSAVGQRPDGSLVLYTVDGRQAGYSVGLGLDAVAERLLDLGCVSAGALDGGASTQLQAILPGGSALGEVNRPSGTKTRSVVNYIFLVTEDRPTGSAARLALYPLDIDVLAGVGIPLKVLAVDENGYPAPPPEDLTFTVSDGLGVVEDGVFWGLTEGEGTLTVSAPGMESDTVQVSVVESPDELLLYGEVYGRHTTSLALAPGQEVDLTVRAFENHVYLSCMDESFTWTLEAPAGTVDGTGHLTPALASGQGMLRVSAGETVTEIPITVWSGVPFGDVPADHPSFDAIRYVYDHQIFQGTEDTAFAPETVMDRAMLVTVLWRMLGCPEPETVPGFWDVDPAAWYGPAVAWAVERGLVTGYSDTLFGPQDTLNREQILTILWRFAGAPMPRELLNDPQDVSLWAQYALAWALDPDYVLTDPDGDGLLRPADPMTRAGVAEVLYRFLTRVAWQTGEGDSTADE